MKKIAEVQRKKRKAKKARDPLSQSLYVLVCRDGRRAAAIL